MSLIGLLIVVLMFCLVYWCVMRLLTAFGVTDPITTVVQVVFVLIFVLWLVGQFGYGPGLRLR
jgi:hypothetical protein